MDIALAAKEFASIHLEETFAALHKGAGLAARMSDADVSENGAHLTVETDDGRSYEIPYAIKKTIDRRDQLISFKNLQAERLLITRSLSSTMAEQCRELGIQFIDQAGNCYLRMPGLLVFISGNRSSTKNQRASAKGLTPSALYLVFAVLTRPSILNSSVRRIAETAGISHGAAGVAMLTLEELGFFTSGKAGRRVLAMPERWLDAWTEGYLGRIRPKLEKYRMSSPVPLSKAQEMLGGERAHAAYGGEAAAAQLGMNLKPGALTLYIHFGDTAVLPKLANALKLHRDPHGSIELVRMFWNAIELGGLPTVPNALIYADLVGTGDERTMEIASVMRMEICRYVASEA